MSDYLNSILLVGCGYMGREYCAVLQALQADICAVGRGEGSAKAFREKTGIQPYTGGLCCFFDRRAALPRRAIVAVGLSALYETVKFLLERGVKTILLEKPGALFYEQIHELSALAEARGADVLIAYNRRFYASVKKAAELIAEDGGVTSFRFEFTEWPHRILPSIKDPIALDRWFLSGSTHVIDLAFYLGGIPEKMCCYRAGSLDWHKDAARYSGAGVTRTGATFSYHADWESAGRWSVEVMTRKRKLILCPLESLRCQTLGSVSVEEIKIDDLLDLQFKPGLFLQTKAFLDSNFSELLTLQEHAKMCEFYQKIERGFTG